MLLKDLMDILALGKTTVTCRDRLSVLNIWSCIVNEYVTFNIHVNVKSCFLNSNVLNIRLYKVALPTVVDFNHCLTKNVAST